MPNIMARAIVMPNLKPPVTTTEHAVSYRQRILDSLPASSDFTPLMTLYLTDNTTPEEITKAKESGVVFAVKLYPAGATTNSDHGITSYEKIDAALGRMAEVGMPLLIHGEVTDPKVDIFEREPKFMSTELPSIVKKHPNLKIVLEHITTKEAVAFVNEAGPNIAATITAHHLLYNRNALFEGGVRPHRYCLPVLKHEADRQALLAAISSGSKKFFLGTDSAPHSKASKECACGAAGMFTAHAAIELYALAFEEVNALEKLKAFACENGPDFYGLERNEIRLPNSEIRLEKSSWTVPDSYVFGSGSVIPAMAGQSISWKATLV
jgi:dihydroorotase